MKLRCRALALCAMFHHIWQEWPPSPLRLQCLLLEQVHTHKKNKVPSLLHTHPIGQTYTTGNLQLIAAVL
jgi:hypothetical protein